MLDLIKELNEKNPTMQQKLDIIQSWFVSKKGNLYAQASVRELGEIILSKGLANDIDSAIKVVLSRLRLSDHTACHQKLELDDFERIFMVALLKDSFLDVLA